MRIGCKTGRPGDGVSYRGSHGQTVRVGRSETVGVQILRRFNMLVLIHAVSNLGAGQRKDDKQKLTSA